MTGKLNAIPIAVVHAPQATGLPGNALAILHELEGMLGALAERRETHSIDLRRAPLTEDDYEYLKNVLGQGDVRAEIDVLGLTSLRETAVPGVWWVTHHNASGKILGEFIEVAACPEILMTTEQDIRSGQRSLRTRLDQSLQVVDRGDIEARVTAMGLSRKDNYSFNPTVNQPVKRGKGNAG